MCFVFPHVESACVHFNLVFRVLASKFSGGWVGVVFVGNVSNHSPILSVAGLQETHRLGFLQLVRKRNASM